MKLGIIVLSAMLLFASLFCVFLFSARFAKERIWVANQPIPRFVNDRLNRAALACSIAFAIGLFSIETYLFQRSYFSQSNGVSYLMQWARQSLLWEMFVHVVVVAFSLGLFAAFVYWALISCALCRVLYFAFFAITVFTEYSSQRSLGRFSDAEDIKLFIIATNLETQTDAIKMFLNRWAIFPCLAFALVLLFFKIPRRKAGIKGLAIVAASIFGFYLLIAQQKVLYKDYLKYPVVSVNAFVRTLADYTKVSATMRESIREEVETVPMPTPPNRNIVFVIDESVRGDHLSLNGYGRKTTPYLEELVERKVLKNWGIASSVATCSESSDLFLATGLRVKDLPDLENKARVVPTIFQYAKALGYRTYYLDGQMNVLWNLRPADMKYLDEWWNLNKFLQIDADRQNVDFSIAETIRGLVTGSRGNFIWVIKSGAHFPYYKRFPVKAAEWTPFFASDRGGEEHKDELVNSYDSAVKYNLNNFFMKLLPDYQIPENTVIVYTSDHGETIGEDGKPNFHCGITKREVIVPLFLIEQSQRKIDTKFRAGHQNIFATLLDLMEAPISIRKREYALSLLQATENDSEVRYYVGPSLLGQDKFRFDSLHTDASGNNDSQQKTPNSTKAELTGR